VVSLVDESIEEDADALVAPDSQVLVRLVKAVWGRHHQAVIDSRQVAKVEDVVELGRCRR